MLKDRWLQGGALIRLEHGQPIRFGGPDADGNPTKGLARDRDTGGVRVVDLVGPDAVGVEELLVHDATRDDPSTAFAISRLTDAGYLRQSPIGIFRQVERPTYDDQARAQVATASSVAPGEAETRLAALVGGGDTWTVA